MTESPVGSSAQAWRRRSRLRPGCAGKRVFARVATALLTLTVLGGCGEYKSADERAAIVAVGERQLETHAEDPLTAPLDLPMLTLVSSRVTGAHVGKTIVEKDPILETSYVYRYEIDPEADSSETLGLAVEYLASIGEIDGLMFSKFANYEVASLGHDLHIDLSTIDSGSRVVLDHTVRIELG